jgi:hypothetical protein
MACIQRLAHELHGVAPEAEPVKSMPKLQPYLERLDEIWRSEPRAPGEEG